MLKINATILTATLLLMLSSAHAGTLTDLIVDPALGVMESFQRIAIDPIPTTEKLLLQKEEIAKEKEKVKDSTTPQAVKKRADLDAAHKALESAEKAIGEEVPGIDELPEILETIRAAKYPSWTVCDGHPWLPTNDKEWSEYFDPVKNHISKIAPYVGMFIQYFKPESGPLKWLSNGATTFAIGASHILTNRHVIQKYAVKVGAKWQLKPNQVISVQFPREYTNCSPRKKETEFEVESVEYVGEDGNEDGVDEDFAVLKVKNNGIPLTSVPLSDKDNIPEGVRVIAIGYPSRPNSCNGMKPSPANPCTFLTEPQIDILFRAPDMIAPFPVERISIGSVLFNPIRKPRQFSYDCSTWGGSSGSPIISLADGTVVGLHFQGLNASAENQGYNNAVLMGKIKPFLDARGFTK